MSEICKRILLLCCLSLLMAACASDEPKEGHIDATKYGEDGPHTFEPEDFSSLESELEKASFECDVFYAGDCPTNLGLLYAEVDSGDKTEISQCSSFLVASNIVATNSHCLTESVRKNPELCSEKIAVRFREVEGHEDIFR